MSALPYLKVATLTLNAGRLILLAASFWKPYLCKLFWLYQIICLAVQESAPIDFGQQLDWPILMDQFVCYCMLHYSAVCDITLSVIGLTYN